MSGKNTMTMRVSGMTCGHCERTVEAAAAGVEGIAGARAHLGSGTLALSLMPGADGTKARKAVAAAVKAAGYDVPGHTAGAAAGARADTWAALAIGLGLVGLFAAANALGVFGAVPRLEAGAGWGILFVTGLLTSLHCVSMCGGIALTQAVGNASGVQRPADAPSARSETLRALSPSLAYNAGRVSGYSAVGALAGSLGSALDPGPLGKAALMGLAGLFMVLMGLRLFGALRLPRLAAPWYGRLRARLGSKAERLGPFAVGVANALMPCGPLQAMQVFALGSGSAIAGAVAMFFFSAGTVPLMMAFGAGGSLLSLRFRSVATRAGAVLVTFLGLAGLGRAWALAGVPSAAAAPFAATAAQRYSLAPDEPAVGGAASTGAEAVQAAAPRAVAPGAARAILADGFQTVAIDLSPRGYREIVVQAGVPVRWTINAEAANLNGCNNAIVVPSLGLQKELQPGANLVEFLPEAAGTIPYSCWMGMIRSRIVVVDTL